jgi:hypothetical protein
MARQNSTMTIEAKTPGHRYSTYRNSGDRAPAIVQNRLEISAEASNSPDTRNRPSRAAIPAVARTTMTVTRATSR